MTMDIDYTGEDYAFPSDVTLIPAKGLTKREYIATEALAALVPSMLHHAPWDIAGRAVELADALLEVIGRKEDEE
jgi:hypothetical protein